MSFAEQSAPAPARLAVGVNSAQLGRLLRRVGWAFIAVQLIGLIAWSTYAAGRSAMTWDFAAYYQPWWAVAHLHLNPAATVMPGGYPFWKNDGEFIIWVLAPLYWLFPNHQLGLWWIQDLAITGGSVVCYRWLGELLPWRPERSLADNAAPAIAWLLVPALLMLNPWVYWSTTFAIQMEPFGVLFAMLALRALLSNRRSVWVWAALAALCGSASIVFVLSVGLAGLASHGWRRYRAHKGLAPPIESVPAAAPRTSVLLIVGAIVWLVVLGMLHATQSFSNPAISVHQDLAYLNGAHSRGSMLLARTAVHAISHPGSVISVIWSHALNLWANTAPVGLIGLISIPGFFMSLPTLLENSILKGQDFSYPGFASLIVYTSVALGSGLVVARLIRYRLWLGLGVAVLLVANAIAWDVTWVPKTGTQYVSIDSGAAQTLSRTATQIPSSAEVIASQGFVGRFAGRTNVQVFGGPSSNIAGPEVFPVTAREVWFVLSPNEGIEVPPTSGTERAIGSVAKLPGVQLVDQAHGIWVFRWRPAGSTRSVALGRRGAAVPAWTTAGTSAQTSLTGAPARWRLTSTSTPGYVVAGDIWRLQQGHYSARLLLSSAAGVNVEVWNDSSNGDVLLARRKLRKTRMRQLVIPFAVGRPAAAPSSTGPAPFSYEPEPPPLSSTVEVRVWSPGTSGVTRVSGLAIVPGEAS